MNEEKEMKFEVAKSVYSALISKGEKVDSTLAYKAIKSAEEFMREWKSFG